MTPRSPASPGSGPRGRRDQVLAVLKDASQPLTTAQIAQRLEVHVNTVRFHLDTLVSAGQVERVAALHRAPGRPPQLFRAVRRMDPTGPRQYQLLAEVLADALAAGPAGDARAVDAGRSWGRRLGDRQARPRGRRAASERLVDLLDELGFAPERMSGARRDGPIHVDLHSCPFLELATSRPSIACPVHLGMMQGAIDAWGGSPLQADLEPFAAPDRCVVRLSAG